MKFSELKTEMRKFNEKHDITRKAVERKNIDGNLIKMTGKIVISSKALRQDKVFSVEERTYTFTNYNKALTSGDLGYSIFAYCDYDGDSMRVEEYSDGDIESAEIIEIVE